MARALRLRWRERTALLVGCAVDEVLVASTGPIGPPLPLERVVEGVSEAHHAMDRSRAAARSAAQAILTTDRLTKEVTVIGPGFTVGGMAKGSGMIRPDMATMLCFLTTDAVVSADDLRQALVGAVDESFHALTIDGCSSDQRHGCPSWRRARQASMPTAPRCKRH